MIKKILLGLLVLIVAFVVIVAFQPAHYSVTRSASIAAPPEVVFAQVNDFHNWNAWSPWVKLDPAATNSFDGPSTGKGAMFHWSGNSQIGEGGMTILESQPNDLIKIKLEFIRPFAAVCVTDFTFKPEGKQTAITWTMSGENNFIGKAMCLFMNMDKTVGGDFDRGLSNLRVVSEAAAAKKEST
jgi:hypothetical protein